MLKKSKKSLGTANPTPVPVWVIATYDESNKPDAMTAAWAGIANSEPPIICVGLRPSRYTYENIKKKQCFSINIPSTALVNQTDYFGIESGRNVDKIKKAGLTANKCKNISAPYIEEFPMHIECKLVERVNLGSHFVVFGKIIETFVDEDKFDGDVPSIKKIDPIVYDTLTKTYIGCGSEVGKGFKSGVSVKKETEQK